MQLTDNTKRFLIFLSAFIVGLVLCSTHISSIAAWLSSALTTFSPFIVGGCIAFLLSVPMKLIDRLLSTKRRGTNKPLLGDGARRPVSLILSILLFVTILVLFVLIVVPQLVETVSSLAGSIMAFVPVAQSWISEFMVWLEGYPELHEFISPYIPDLNAMASTLIAFVQKFFGVAASSLVSGVSTIFSSATDVIISFVFAIYILLQTDSLSRQSKKLIYAFLPKRFCDTVLRVAGMAHKTFFSYVTIQCTEAMILGALCFAGMVLFRFPHALVISVIMLFCALIPIYGAIISCVVGAFLVLIESPMQALGFIVFILVLQQLETNLIYPRVVSTSINLPPMWVLLAVTVGGGLFGLVGMITAVPITSIGYTLLGELTAQRLEARRITPEDFAVYQPPEKPAEKRPETKKRRG
ncbi:MAG: AI-2E family transporter [Clostridia bacterium]|nr:AI-2E family transporter [Clostridia bacterium]